MVVWLALLIPFISSYVLYKYYKHNLVWWELFIPLIVSLASIIIVKYSVEYIHITYNEYWGGLVTKVEYYEEWNEYIHKICTRTVSCGENCTKTETYDCSYVNYHPEKYLLYNTNSTVLKINREKYLEIKRKFKNSTFVDMKRNYHTIDGDMYHSIWDGRLEKAEPTTTSHKYKNKIKASNHSIFNFGKVTKEDIETYNLKEYPKIYSYYKQNPIIGYVDENASKQLDLLNGYLGKNKQVKVFVCVFENQPLEAGLMQEWYWVGGNKNEVVVCIGKEGNNISWVHPFSWTTNYHLLTDIKTDILEMGLFDLSIVVSYLYPKIDNEFVRREFVEFDYLSVNPPMCGVGLVFLLTIITNLLIGRWIIINEYR